MNEACTRLKAGQVCVVVRPERVRVHRAAMSPRRDGGGARRGGEVGLGKLGHRFVTARVRALAKEARPWPASACVPVRLCALAGAATRRGAGVVVGRRSRMRVWSRPGLAAGVAACACPARPR